VARRLRRSDGGANGAGTGGVQWFTPADLLARVGSPVLRDPGTLAALTVAARSPLLPEWSGGAFGDVGEAEAAPDAVARASRVTLSELRTAALPEAALDPARLAPEQFLNAELSWLEFNARVLALAEDPRTPPAARLRFISIFSTNLDQFVMTQLGALKQLVALGRAGPSADGLRPQETLDAVAVRLRPLLARQDRAFAAQSLGIARWAELTPEERGRLRLWLDADAPGPEWARATLTWEAPCDAEPRQIVVRGPEVVDVFRECEPMKPLRMTVTFTNGLPDRKRSLYAALRAQ